MDDSILTHPQSLNLAERMERAVYLGLDDRSITANSQWKKDYIERGKTDA